MDGFRQPERDVGGREGEQEGEADRVLDIAEVTARPTLVRCMGRRYRVVRAGDTVAFEDITDPTHPIALGTARRSGDGPAWDILTSRDKPLAPMAGVLPAIATLRSAHWP